MSRRPLSKTSIRATVVRPPHGPTVANPDSRPVGRRLLTAALAVASLPILLAAGCGGRGVDPQSAPPKSQPTAASPSPTVTAPTELQRAGQDAAVRVPIYERLLSELAIHRNLPVNKLYGVSTQPDVNQEISSINSLRERQERQIGLVRVVGTRVDHVDLTNRPHGRHARLPTIRVTACLNVSGVQGLDANGRSVVPKTRKPYLLAHLTLTNARYPQPSKWLVSRVSDEETRTCAV
jgi:hypothetical protein